MGECSIFKATENWMMKVMVEKIVERQISQHM